MAMGAERRLLPRLPICRGWFLLARTPLIAAHCGLHLSDQCTRCSALEVLAQTHAWLAADFLSAGRHDASESRFTGKLPTLLILRRRAQMCVRLSCLLSSRSVMILMLILKLMRTVERREKYPRGTVRNGACGTRALSSPLISNLE